MAPLSILPGRTRFHAAELQGRAVACQRFEDEIARIEGITEATANHRTGRVLVRFDETVLNRNLVFGKIVEALSAAEKPVDSEKAAPSSRQAPAAGGAGKGHSGIGRHVLREAVTQILLPSPLDLLLPTAAAILRR